MSSSSSPPVSGGGGRRGGGPPVWVVVLTLLVLTARFTEAAQNLRHVLADSDQKEKPSTNTEIVDDVIDDSIPKSSKIVEDTADPAAVSSSIDKTVANNLRRLAGEQLAPDVKDVDDEVEPDFGYWLTPIAALGLTCGGASIKSRDGQYVCIKAGEALCQDNDGGPFGRWTFGIIEENGRSTVNLWTPKNEVAWTFCADVTHVCIGEERDPRPNKFSNERPYLYFYDEKTQRAVGNLTCDGTDGFNGENLGRPTILKMVDNSDVGMYANYNVTVLKFKKGQTPDPGDSNELFNITVDRVGQNMVGFMSFKDSKCRWTDHCPSGAPSGEPSTSPSPLPSSDPSDEPSLNPTETRNVITSIPNNTAAVIEMTDVVTASFPAAFFENKTVLTIEKSTFDNGPKVEQLFQETASIYNPTSRAGYHIILRSSSAPSEKKIAVVSVDIEDTFASSIPTTDRAEVFVLIEQSSDLEDDPFPIFALIEEDWDYDSQIISFRLPSFAFSLSADGTYETAIVIASTPGLGSDESPSFTPNNKRARRRLQGDFARGRNRPPICQGNFILCPLVKGCNLVASPFDLVRFHPELMAFRPHFGVDYEVSVGDIVIAASSGVVELVKTQLDDSEEPIGYGLYVVIRHDDGGATLYAHLSSTPAIIKGEYIEEGQVIGLAGDSGSTNGPNLHFEYAPSGSISSSKHRIDPHPCVTSLATSASETCQDNAGNKGECVYTSSCQGDDRIAIDDGLCSEYSDINVKCCIRTPKCNSIGGKCLQKGECGAGHFISSSDYCPGSNTECCVKDDVCQTRDGGVCESKSSCLHLGGLFTSAICPGSSDVCCIPSRSCKARHDHDGTCYQDDTSCIDNGGIPTYDATDCSFGPCCVFPADIPECLVADRTLEEHSRIFGVCSLEENCNVGPPDFSQKWEFGFWCPGASKCCHTLPPPSCTPAAVSDVVKFEFDTSLYNEDYFREDPLELQHRVEVDVQCFECDGELTPKIINVEKEVRVNEYDDGELRLLDPLSIADGKEILIQWVGNAWEGDWKEEEENVFGAVASTSVNAYATFPGVGAGAIEYSASRQSKVNPNMMIEVLDHARKNVNIKGKELVYSRAGNRLVPVLGDIASLAIAGWDLFFDTELMFLYRNTVRFRCEERSGRGIIPIASEVYGSESANRDEDEDLTYPSAPAFSVLETKADQFDIYLRHDSHTTGAGEVEKYELPSGPSLGFGPTKRFSLDTQLVEGLVFGRKKVREHHRALIALRCTTEGEIDIRGLMPPVLVKSGKSLIETFFEGADTQSSPQMSRPIVSNDKGKITFFMSGLALNGDLKSAALGYQIFSIVSSALLVTSAIVLAVGSGGTLTPLVAYGVGAGLGIIAATIAEQFDVEYQWLYVRRFSFQCLNNGSEWIVRRAKESQLCSYFKQVDGDEEDYFFRIDNGESVGDDYNPTLVDPSPRRYEVLEDCKVPDFEEGEWPTYEEDFLEFVPPPGTCDSSDGVSLDPICFSTSIETKTPFCQKNVCVPCHEYDGDEDALCALLLQKSDSFCDRNTGACSPPMTKPPTVAPPDPVVGIYWNNFESINPNLPPRDPQCNGAVNYFDISTLYSKSGFILKEKPSTTFEAVLLNGVNDASGQPIFEIEGDQDYQDSPHAHGEYALGGFSSQEDDMLAFTVDSFQCDEINVYIDLAPGNLPGCGGPFFYIPGIDYRAEILVKLIDSPGGLFDWNDGGALLDEEILVELDHIVDGSDLDGVPFKIEFRRVGVTLNSRESLDGYVTIVLDIQGNAPYAIFDNISVSGRGNCSTPPPSPTPIPTPPPSECDSTNGPLGSACYNSDETTPFCQEDTCIPCYEYDGGDADDLCADLMATLQGSDGICDFDTGACIEPVVTAINENDYETLNLSQDPQCNGVAFFDIDALFSKPGFTFKEKPPTTFEAVLLNGIDEISGQQIFENPQGIGGNYALGGYADQEDDMLAFTFHSRECRKITVNLDLSAANLPGCGGPFNYAPGTAYQPELNVKLIDSPGGVFDWNAGQHLDEDTIIGVSVDGSDLDNVPFKLTWKNGEVTLDNKSSTDGFVSLVFDFKGSPYSIFDNFVVTGKGGCKEYTQSLCQYGPVIKEGIFPTEGDFGTSIAIDAIGSTIVVGSPQFDGGQERELQNIGKIQDFVRTSLYPYWEPRRLPIYGSGRLDNLGESFAISGDANFVAASADNEIRVYRNELGEWKRHGSNFITNAGIVFPSSSVDISNDGGLVVVSGAGPRIFRLEDNVWTEMNRLDGETEMNRLDGAPVGISGDGDIVAYGDPSYGDGTNDNVGRVYIFTLENNSWNVSKVLTGDAADSRFGTDLSLSNDGFKIAVGIPGATGGGTVQVFEFSPGNIIQLGRDVEGVGGSSVSLSGSGDVFVALDEFYSKARAFSMEANEWTLVGETAPEFSDARFSDGMWKDGRVSISADGRVFTVASPREDLGAVRIFGIQSGVCLYNLPRFGEQKVVASDGATSTSSQQFGSAIACFNAQYCFISTHILYDENFVYTFKKTGPTWEEIGKQQIGGRESSPSVPLSMASNGSFLMVGVPSTSQGLPFVGAVHFLKHDGNGNLVEEKVFTDPEPRWGGAFGYSVAMDGSTAIVGARPSNREIGKAHVFIYDGNDWNHQQELQITPNPSYLDRFGHSVAVTGNCAFVGAPYNGQGSIYIFTRNSEGTWEDGIEFTPAQPSAGFGYSIDASGDFAVIGSRNAEVYVLRRDNSNPNECDWSLHQRLKRSYSGGEGFGQSVSISDDASTVLVGTPSSDDDGEDSGSVDIFRRQNDGFLDAGFKLTAYDATRGDLFGSIVHLAGTSNALVGAPHADTLEASSTGSAYIFPLENIPPL